MSFRIIFMLTWLLVPIESFTKVDISKPNQEEDVLSSAVKDFFEAWLIQKDMKAASKFISSSPILGTCLMAESSALEAKAGATEIIRRTFSAALDDIPRSKLLSELMASPKLVSAKDENIVLIDHSMKQAFDMFRLKKEAVQKEVRYICKFDDRKVFRDKVTRSDVYYIIGKIRTNDSKHFVNLETIWVKEKGFWRILTIAVAED